jgi:hypothetical protein
MRYHQSSPSHKSCSNWAPDGCFGTLIGTLIGPGHPIARLRASRCAVKPDSPSLTGDRRTAGLPSPGHERRDAARMSVGTGLRIAPRGGGETDSGP